MREVLDELIEVRRRGGTAAMATVVRTWRSAPRPAGASMLVTDSGEAVGSVSGGCVEGALFEVGQEVLGDGVPQFETYGVSDDDAFAVGLTCGGILEVFIERVDDSTWPELEGIAASIAAQEPVAIATIVKGDHSVGRGRAGQQQRLGIECQSCVLSGDCRWICARRVVSLRRIRKWDFPSGRVEWEPAGASRLLLYGRSELDKSHECRQLRC